MKTFFTPGPSQLYPTVQKHIQKALEHNIASISHRSSTFQEITKETVMHLRKLLEIPEDYHIFFLSSATEAMERIIENCVGKHSFHSIAGSFGEKFYEIAKDLKKNALRHNIDMTKTYTNTFTIPLETELMCVTQNETSNGWLMPVDKIYALRQEHPQTLIAVDIVSSAPYVNIDYQKVDLAFFSVQKAFGLPAGLGILIVSPGAMNTSHHLQKTGVNTGSYHNFLSLAKHMENYQTPETPNVLAIFLLNEVLKDFLAIGMAIIRNETEQKATILYEFLEQHPHLHPAIQTKENRSKTVIVASGNRLAELRNYLETRDMIIGEGYGKEKETQIRIANFPSHSLEDTQRLLLNIKEFYHRL